MFSFKAFSDPKLQTSSLFAYQAARNVMWASVLTRLKVAISWHINILCVCTTGVGFEHSCEKPQRLNHCIFRHAAPNIQDRTRKDKSLMDSKYTTHPPNWGHRRSLSRDCIPLGHWGMWTKSLATTNLCYWIIWLLWSSKQWQSERWSP